jgi:dihydroxyacetone kinase
VEEDAEVVGSTSQSCGRRGVSCDLKVETRTQINVERGEELAEEDEEDEES